MNKIFLSTIISLFIVLSVEGQRAEETVAYFDLIKGIVTNVNSGNDLFHQLDTLKSKFIPSRSSIDDYLNRDIDFGFKHRRIIIRLNFNGYQVDALCLNDTILLASITSFDNDRLNYDKYNKGALDDFIKRRNGLYQSSKTTSEIVKEISSREVYAFHCGFGMSKTQKGQEIELIVANKNIASLTAMLKSISCETQAFGVAGLEMLAKQNVQIPNDAKRLINHIKARNSDVVICSGCISGLVEKLYSND